MADARSLAKFLKASYAEECQRPDPSDGRLGFRSGGCGEEEEWRGRETGRDSSTYGLCSASETWPDGPARHGPPRHANYTGHAGPAHVPRSLAQARPPYYTDQAGGTFSPHGSRLFRQ